ncbi:hypothetical protein, partial [Staphylococcus aureus]
VPQFTRQIDSSAKSVHRFKRVSDPTLAVELTANDKKLQNTITFAKKSLDAFSNKNVKAKLDASIQDLRQKVLQSNFELYKLNS